MGIFKEKSTFAKFREKITNVIVGNPNLDEEFLEMGKSTSKSTVGTGGMATKLTAARIASAAGVDMVIANGADFHIIHKITEGRDYGTLFVGQSREEFYLIDIIDKLL